MKQDPAELRRRSFKERLRDPDPDFPRFLHMLGVLVPFMIVVFPLFLFVFQIFSTAAFGESARPTTVIGSVVRLAAILAGPAAIISWVALRIVRLRVWQKVRTK